MSCSIADFYAFYEKNNFERSRRFAPNAYSPEPLRKALKELDNPHNVTKIFHVGGTVAKGSLCYLIAHYYQSQKEIVGLYTSPHLLRLNERIVINGREISDQEFSECYAILKEKVDISQLSFFDALTAIAFLYFKQQKVTMAVIEVGLGGRLDSTNVVNPAAVFLGPVGMDHQNILGNTLPEIAREEGGIIKPDTKVFSMRQQEEVKKIFCQLAAQQGAEIFFPSYSTSADYRKQNLSFVSAALSILEKQTINLTPLAIPGRFEKLSSMPDILFDAAHNAPAMQSLAKLLASAYPRREKIIYFSCMKERDPKELLAPFVVRPQHKIIFPDISLPNCHTAEELKQLMHGKGQVVTPSEVKQLLKDSQRVHLFCGTMQLYPVARSWVS